MSNRRDFLRVGAGASLATLTNNSIFFNGKEKALIKGKILTEPKIDIPVFQETDVIVCGGGPAGIASAVASARGGARTTLIEMYGCLGGVWTTGLLSNLIDYQNKPGIMKELVDELEKSGAQYSAKVYDAEVMKIILDKMCLKAGVDVRLYTRVVTAYKGSGNKVEHIVTESFSGREAWRAKLFIDTTGNGELAARAGCGFDLGHPETGNVQPASLMAIIVGVKEEELVNEGFMERGGQTSEQSKMKLHEEIKRAGTDASYTKPTMFAIRPDIIAIMANHQYGVSVLDTRNITEATLESRREINQIIDGLRSLGGVWSGVRIATTGAQLGIREGRRIHGLYTISSQDLINGARFDDAVCRVTFSVDVHSLARDTGGGYSNQGIKAKPYDIPLRSLIAKDVTGLMMAGRCISGDFFAHASYRVTGNAVMMGEAAGKVAAVAAMKNILPQEVKYNP